MVKDTKTSRMQLLKNDLTVARFLTNHRSRYHLLWVPFLASAGPLREPLHEYCSVSVLLLFSLTYYRNSICIYMYLLGRMSGFIFSNPLLFHQGVVSKTIKDPKVGIDIVWASFSCNLIVKVFDKTHQLALQMKQNIIIWIEIILANCSWVNI